VELADLYRLGGLDADAGEYLGWAKQMYASLDDHAGRARCLVVEATGWPRRRPSPKC
jgi:hypothetical protein